jgi:uncharacterized protein (TIGR03437 family)
MDKPLPQTLGGLTLRCSDFILPLLYVSPGQVNFQTPAALSPGEHRVEIHRANGPMLEAVMTVARHAPGLLIAAHPDGEPVTAGVPASPGQNVTLFAAGSGPFLPIPLDGFPIPSAPPYLLEDPVEVWIQGRRATVERAAAAPGTVGVASLLIRLPDDLDVAAPASAVIRVGGVASNALALPLR